MEIFLQLQVFSGNTKAHAAGMTAAKEGIRQVSGGEKGREHKGAEHLFKCGRGAVCSLNAQMTDGQIEINTWPLGRRDGEKEKRHRKRERNSSAQGK